MPRTPPSDTALERIAWVLAAAVAALIVREVWQALRDRSQRRTRDRLILTALAREVLVVRAAAAAIVQEINRERALLSGNGRWSLKPLIALPASIYDLARDPIPKALLEQEDAIVEVIGLQTQCAYMNRLAEEHQRWKSPSARSQPDQLEVILQFHAPLEETITAVIDRCDRLFPVIDAAGKKVGGLDLKKVEPANDTKATSAASAATQRTAGEPGDAR
jgi:hypothetical protein